MSEVRAGTIAFFSGFSLPHVGGVETYTRRVALELVRRGYRVIVVSANDDGSPWSENVEGIEEIRVPVLPIAKNRYPIPVPGPRLVRTMADLRRAGIDRVVVNTRFYVSSLLGAWFGKRHGIPVSLIEHGSAPLTLDSPVLDAGLDAVERILTRMIRGKLSGVYGVSRAAARHVHERFGIRPAGVWFNSIDVVGDDDTPRPAASPESATLTISYAGRVIRQKGVDTLLEAFDRCRQALAPKGYTLECVIAGDGAYLPELRERFGAAPGVRFVGRIPQVEVRALLRRTDVFVYVPTTPEGLPSSLLEAGAESCAVIASPQGGIGELIDDDRTGLLVESDVEALTAALTALVTDPAKRQRLGDALHTDVLGTFSTPSVVDRMLADLGLERSACPVPAVEPGAAVRRRVLHLLGTDRVSGAENVIATIMELFRGSDVEMVYCSPDGPIRETLAERDLAFVPLSSLTPWGVRAVLREQRFDVVHAHDFKASVVAAIAGFHGPVVSHIHSNPGFVKSWNPFSLVYRAVCGRFSRAVFVSDEATRGTVFAAALGVRARVIHNVIDRERVQRLATETTVEPRDVVFLGRLTELKQPLVVLRAVARARTLGATLTARLVGDGELREACEQEVERLGLGDAVTLEGFRPNPYPYVGAGRVAMMPSTFEGLPLAAIECLALGVPVLNSGAGGLFREHPQFLCRTPEEYAARLVELQDDAVYASFRAACAEIVAPYVDLGRYREQIRELYAD